MPLAILNTLLKYASAMLCTAVLLTSCADDNQSTAEVRISRIDRNYPVYLVRMDTGLFRAIDSVMKPDEDVVSFSFSLEQSGVYFIQNKDIEAEFIAVPNEKANLNLASEYIIEDSGSLNLKYSKFIKTIHSLERQADSLSYRFMTAQSTDSFPKVRQSVANSFEVLLMNAKSEAISYISNNPSSIGVFRAINYVIRQTPIFNYAIDLEWFHMTDSLLGIYHPGHPYTIWLHNKVMYNQLKFGDITLNNKYLSKGFILPEITLPGLNNKQIKVAPILNGITLLYLWDHTTQSRQTNTRVKLINEKYKDRKFKLYTIAFYDNYKQWSTVIVIDKLWGNNMIDTVGHKSEIMKMLNYPPFPSFILIDRNSMVMAHFGNTIQLEEWLNRYFKQNETNKLLN